MAKDLLTGGCFCGQVRYECGAFLSAAIFCHCESCRRISGTHVVAWITIAAEHFSFTKGKPTAFNSSKRVSRTFCPQCGTPLTYRNERWAGEIDVTLATLDNSSTVIPSHHVYMEDALPWDRPNDGLPQYARTRDANPQ